MKLILAIGLGSFFGGISRYLLSEFIKSFKALNFSYATFLVNIIGCFLIGVFFSLIEKNLIDKTWFAILSVGFLGGFTTFSAFSIDAFKMLREQNYLSLFLFVFGSVLFGLLATTIGYFLVKR